MAKTSPAQPAPVEEKPANLDERIVVVDANAIISGLHLEGLSADRYCTIAEVLSEVRDKHARQFLTMLPYQLDVREPAEESLKAGKLPVGVPLTVSHHLHATRTRPCFLVYPRSPCCKGDRPLCFGRA